MSDILVPVSAGELVDKLTILAIKSEKIVDAEKLKNIQSEFDALSKVAAEALPQSENLKKLWSQLQSINEDLWTIEEDIRAYEDRSDFGAGFVALARSVYVTNDERFAIKRRINILVGSRLVEEKSYRG